MNKLIKVSFMIMVSMDAGQFEILFKFFTFMFVMYYNIGSPIIYVREELGEEIIFRW